MESLAITLTVRPLHYKRTLSVQYDMVLAELKKVPFLISVVAEITKSGNLHCHGVLEAKKPKRGTLKQAIHEYFRNNSTIGFIYITKINDLHKWIQYCLKDYEVTRKDIDCAPIVMIDQCNSFPEGLELLEIILTANNNKDMVVNIETLLTNVQ